MFKKIITTLTVSCISSMLLAGTLYWTDDAAGVIQSADPAVGTPTTILSGLSTPRGIAVDNANSKIYYTQDGTSTVSSVNINGTANTTLVTSAGSGTRGISLDLVSNEMYWVSFNAGTIRKEVLTGGTGLPAILSGRDVPGDIEIDVSGGKMYWGEVGSTLSIFRANLDGTSIETLATAASPNFLSLDLTNNKVYWTNFAANSIERMNLDGTSRETVFTLGSGSVEGIALDVDNSLVYFGDSGNSNIRRVDFNGNNETTIVTGLNAPHELRFIPEPSTYALIFGIATIILVPLSRKFLQKKDP